MGVYNVAYDSRTGHIGWIGLREDHIDAALVTQRFADPEKPYIFRRDLVYLMEEIPIPRIQPPFQQVKSGWPKKISVAFPGIPNDLDTAFVWDFDRTMYFFKGEFFYIYHPGDEAKSSLPYKIDQWKNVCDIYECLKAESLNDNYECDSWAFTKVDFCNYYGCSIN